MRPVVERRRSCRPACRSPGGRSRTCEPYFSALPWSATRSPLLEHPADPVGASKPDALERAARVVGHVVARTGSGRLARHWERFAGDRADDRDGLGPCRPDLARIGVTVRAVEVAARVVAEQVPERVDAGLAQRNGAALADAGQGLDVGVEDVGMSFGAAVSGMAGASRGGGKLAGRGADVCQGAWRLREVSTLHRRVRRKSGDAASRTRYTSWFTSAVPLDACLSIPPSFARPSTARSRARRWAARIRGTCRARWPCRWRSPRV